MYGICFVSGHNNEFCRCKFINYGVIHYIILYFTFNNIVFDFLVWFVFICFLIWFFIVTIIQFGQDRGWNGVVTFGRWGLVTFGRTLSIRTRHIKIMKLNSGFKFWNGFWWFPTWKMSKYCDDTKKSHLNCTTAGEIDFSAQLQIVQRFHLDGFYAYNFEQFFKFNLIGLSKLKIQ